MNRWNQKYGPPSSIHRLTPVVIPGFTYNEYTGAAPVKSGLELWQTVNESKNKLQLVCQADELVLINSLTNSLNVETGSFPDFAECVKVSAPERQQPAFQLAYQSARLSLINAYRHDVLNLQPLPSVDPLPAK
ncbi:hypothetical protein GCM10023346_20720 [Arthrobacter gyeryongensis]|uniref:Uncharacterized protein n=1 Tax=Arthrobacter gyeryongensis TaxID=1650592 RepID=A0ABP9SD25_9MICC